MDEPSRLDAENKLMQILATVCGHCHTFTTCGK